MITVPAAGTGKTEKGGDIAILFTRVHRLHSLHRTELSCSAIWALIIVLALSAVGFVLGRQRALSASGGDRRKLHSLPKYYGANVALKTLVPASHPACCLVNRSTVDHRIIQYPTRFRIQQSARNSSLGLVMAEVRRAADSLDNAVALGAMSEEMAGNARVNLTDITQRLKDAGQIVTSEITQPVLVAAQKYRIMRSSGQNFMVIVAVLLALIGLMPGVCERQPSAFVHAMSLKTASRVSADRSSINCNPDNHRNCPLAGIQHL